MKQNKDTEVKKNVLKMVSDGMFESREIMMRVYNSIPADERDNNSWWYLHGKLESEVGFDKATTTNCKSAGYSKETINWRAISDSKVTEIFEDKPLTIHRMYINGEVPVEIEKIEKKCIGFFWTEDWGDVQWEGKKYPHWSQRGLVCYADDDEACEYARQAMTERRSMI